MLMGIRSLVALLQLQLLWVYGQFPENRPEGFALSDLTC
jgi:hypothetical protein